MALMQTHDDTAVLQHLRAILTTLDDHAQDMAEIKHRLDHLVDAFGSLSGRLDRLAEKIDRIDASLGRIDAALPGD